MSGHSKLLTLKKILCIVSWLLLTINPIIKMNKKLWYEFGAYLN